MLGIHSTHTKPLFILKHYRTLYFAIGNFDLMTCRSRHFPGSRKILLKNYRYNRKVVEDLRSFPKTRSSTAFLLQKNLRDLVFLLTI